MGAPKASAGGRKPRPPHEEGGESTPIPTKSRRRQKTKNSKNGSTPKSGRAKSEKGRTRKWLTEMEFHAMDTGRHETAAVIPSAPTKATCLRGDGPRHSHVNSGITTGTPRAGTPRHGSWMQTPASKRIHGRKKQAKAVKKKVRDNHESSLRTPARCTQTALPAGMDKKNGAAHNREACTECGARPPRRRTQPARNGGN